jgi:hypothetical protein
MWDRFNSAGAAVRDWTGRARSAVWSLCRRSRTIVCARALQLAGAVTALESMLSGQDWTPVMLRIFATVPADLRPLAIGCTVAAIGGIFEYLRWITREPVQ